MTVGTKMSQVIASVQSTAATLKTFALETEDQQAKQTFQGLAETFDNVLTTLQAREQYIKEQEPQYKQ